MTPANVDLRPHREGVVLPVRAMPGSRTAGIRGVFDGALRVSVTQVAEKGRANRSLIDVLSKKLGLRRSQIELLAGAASGRKSFLVRGVSTAELQQRLSEALREE